MVLCHLFRLLHVHRLLEAVAYQVEAHQAKAVPATMLHRLLEAVALLAD